MAKLEQINKDFKKYYNKIKDDPKAIKNLSAKDIKAYTEISKTLNDFKNKIDEQNHTHITGKQIYDAIDTPKNYTKQYDEDSQSVALLNNKIPHIVAYVNIDQYTPGHPLQITDDSNTLFDANGKLDSHQWSLIESLLSFNKISQLEMINELIINTSLKTLNEDLRRYLKTIELVDVVCND